MGEKNSQTKREKNYQEIRRAFNFQQLDTLDILNNPPSGKKNAGKNFV